MKELISDLRQFTINLIKRLEEEDVSKQEILAELRSWVDEIDCAELEFGNKP